jgi:hypothetical protein
MVFEDNSIKEEILSVLGIRKLVTNNFSTLSTLYQDNSLSPKDARTQGDAHSSIQRNSKKK